MRKTGDNCWILNEKNKTKKKQVETVSISVATTDAIFYKIYADVCVYIYITLCKYIADAKHRWLHRRVALGDYIHRNNTQIHITFLIYENN